MCNTKAVLKDALVRITRVANLVVVELSQAVHKSFNKLIYSMEKQF